MLFSVTKYSASSECSAFKVGALCGKKKKKERQSSVSVFITRESIALSNSSSSREPRHCTKTAQQKKWMYSSVLYIVNAVYWMIMKQVCKASNLDFYKYSYVGPLQTHTAVLVRTVHSAPRLRK